MISFRQVTLYISNFRSRKTMKDGFLKKYVLVCKTSHVYGVFFKKILKNPFETREYRRRREQKCNFYNKIFVNFTKYGRISSDVKMMPF